jgi:hypothetical protein
MDPGLGFVVNQFNQNQYSNIVFNQFSGAAARKSSSRLEKAS